MAVIYFERLTPTRWSADAHIQTPCDPVEAAVEFSLNHPGFTGAVEVSVQEVVGGRPVLTAVLVRVDGPGRCFELSAGSDLAVSR